MTADALRSELAVATRMLVDAGILGYSGHLSARLPGTDHLLIQSVDDPRVQVSPENVLEVDFDGSVAAGSGKPPSELAIHVGVYRRRPDVQAVAHVHHDPTTAFSLVRGRPLVPVKNHASRWIGGIPVHPDGSHISTEQQGRAVAETLGDRHALLLRGHGQVVVAESVRTLFADLIHFVENADVLAKVLQLGEPEPLTPAEADAFLATFHRDRHADKVWRYFTTVAAAAGRLPAQRTSPPASQDEAKSLLPRS